MKFFSSNRIKTKVLRKQICILGKHLGVQKITFNNKGKDIRGSYLAGKCSMYIDMKQTKREMLHTFFHELAHHTAVTEGIWYAYHYSPNNNGEFSPEEQFTIENGIDKIANNLWNKYVDIKRWGRYKYAYLKSNKTYLINWLKQRTK